MGMFNHVFTTPVLREDSKVPAADLAAVAACLIELRQRVPGETKSNRGGWHSAGNLFGPEYGEFPAIRAVATQALFRYIGEVFGYRGEIHLSLTAWTVINGPGDYNVPHNHAANLLSGAFYVAVPPGMKGGDIVFQDPRLNLNAHDTDAMRRLNIRPPWMSPTISVAPAAGEILIFPSWLIHWVEPFACEDAAALRIVISFNATAV
jgi:uncharacterized protein (TIGR02466 family)